MRHEGHGMRTMRRVAAGHETHLLEIKGLQHLEGRSQVAKVNRVERAAENADWPHARAMPITMSVAICHGSP